MQQSEKINISDEEKPVVGPEPTLTKEQQLEIQTDHAREQEPLQETGAKEEL